MNYDVLIAVVVAGVVAVPVLLWCVIAWAGSAPVMTLHKVFLNPLPEPESREILFSVLTETPHLDGDWLNAEGFTPIGVFQAEGLFGTPNVIAWGRRGEATWLCGYLLPDGTCQLDFVLQLGESMLTTGTAKDGHLFPTEHGKFVQTFDRDRPSDLWQLHQQATQFLSTSFGLQIDRGVPDFAECFADSLRAEGEYVRSMFLWSAPIPWWYFTRRHTRHNRTAEQLCG